MISTLTLKVYKSSNSCQVVLLVTDCLLYFDTTVFDNFKYSISHSHYYMLYESFIIVISRLPAISFPR